MVEYERHFGRPQLDTAITFKRGKCENEFDNNKWLGDVANEHSEGLRNVIIRLLNEQHQVVASWSLTRCFPVKIISLDLTSYASEAAIESLEIAHEGLKLIKS